MFKTLRRLSERQSDRCENARKPTCRCRCGGAMHGKARGSVWDLPLGDPHSLKKECAPCAGRGGFVMPGGRTLPCVKCDGVGYTEPKKKIVPQNLTKVGAES